MLAKEIQNTRKIINVCSKLEENRTNSICQIIDYGIIIINNFDGQCEEEVLVGYYFMPNYGTNLYDYLIGQKKVNGGMNI